MAESKNQDISSPVDAQEAKQQPQDDSSIETKSAEESAPPLPDEAPPLPVEVQPVPEEAPPLPEEAPPLPNEQPPLPVEEVDDGWRPMKDQNGVWFFWNEFTNQMQYENPRFPDASYIPPAYQSTAIINSGPPGSEPLPASRPVAGGYNPAIHGDYDPNADYAQEAQSDDERTTAPPPNPEAIYAAVGSFNRFTGKWQAGDKGPELHNDENKSKRQMNAFFDVDAAANSHDGRSLKAERQQKKLSKQEVKAFKEKRRAKKEEKRRAWLMD